MATIDVTPGLATPHLLHVFPSFSIGGMPLRTVRVMRHLGARWRHTVVSLDGIMAAAQQLPEGVHVTLVPMIGGESHPIANLFAIHRFLRRCRPDLLATYNWGAIEWAAINRIAPVCPHIHFEAGFHTEEATTQFRRRVLARRFALAKTASVVVPSRTLERIALDIWRLPRAQISYVPDGIDVARFTQAKRQSQSEIVIGTVAPLRPEKNIGRLIEAFHRVAVDPRFRLVIAGDGSERARLERLVTERGLTQRVTFLGQVARPETVLSEFDLFALSSDTEQIPNAVLEAMATGLPIASVDVGDVRIMVAPANQPYIVPRDDTAALTGALRALANAPDLRRQLGAANRHEVERRFRQELMFQHYEEILLGAVHDGFGSSPAREAGLARVEPSDLARQ